VLRCIFNQTEIQNGQKKVQQGIEGSIALDAIKGQKTIAELASEYGVHANQISIWKKQLIERSPPTIATRGNRIMSTTS